MPYPTIQLSDSQLDQLLAQDAPLGDLTTEALGIADRPGRISFALRADGVVCGAEEAARLFRLAGAEAEALHRSGTRLDAGTVVLAGRGPAGALHRAWKVAQTLMEYAGGIATRTRRIVEAA